MDRLSVIICVRIVGLRLKSLGRIISLHLVKSMVQKSFRYIFQISKLSSIWRFWTTNICWLLYQLSIIYG